MSPVQQLQPASPQPAADTATTDDEPDKQQEQQQEPAEVAGSSQSDSSSLPSTAAEQQQQQQQPSSAVSMLVLCDPRFQQSKQLLAGLDFAFPDAPKVGQGQGWIGNAPAHVRVADSIA
jgi:hypothetical protein